LGCWTRSSRWEHFAAVLPPLPHAAKQRLILCYVTDRRELSPSAGPSELLAVIERVSAAAADWIQIREKDLSAREMLDLSRRAVAAAGTTKILVNERLDVALAARAAGVHLGGESAPVAEVVRWCRAGHASAEFLIGASCHSLAEVVAAESSGADYVFFGPVFATPSKLRYGAPQGIERLAEVSRQVRIPLIAIGGITMANAEQCFRSGAAGIAAIRLFQQAADLAALVKHLRAE
jgi:thiamine-phosphate pyrophosphorylase